MSSALSQSIENPSAGPLGLMKALLAQYGVDWLGWTYTALKMTLERELHVQVPELALCKAMSAAAVATQDSFWREWEHFHFLTQALCGDVPDYQNHAELSVGRMMRAVLLANGIRGELGKLSYTVQFSDEVARYVAAQALQDGVWYLPAPLDFAGRHASGLSYRCRDCGNTSEVVFDDGLCDVCVDRFDTSRLGAWEPDPKLIAEGRGKNIEYFEKRPTEPVRKRLEERLRHPDRTLQENSADICVARLLAAMEYAGYHHSPEGRSA